MNKKQVQADKKFNDAFLLFREEMKKQGIDITKEAFIKECDKIINNSIKKVDCSLNNAIEDVNSLIKYTTIPEKKLKEHIKNWTNENEPLGELLGYPKCCIKEFCNQPPIVLESNILPTDEDQMRYESACIDGDFTGFIPCVNHAKQIKDGKIKLSSLIKNRDIHFAKFPFALK